ncbi:hypothetical protein [Streptomyces sp. NPDC001139]
MRASVTQRHFIPFGPVLRQRAGWLRTQGLLTADDEKEELVIVRAELPV